MPSCSCSYASSSFPPVTQSGDIQLSETLRTEHGTQQSSGAVKEPYAGSSHTIGCCLPTVAGLEHNNDLIHDHQEGHLLNYEC